MRLVRFYLLGLVALAALATLLLAAGALHTAPRAHANHIPGVRYTGTHSGGGTVTFRTSADGTEITEYDILGIPGDSPGYSCTAIYKCSLPGYCGAAIENHTFEHTADFSDGGAGSSLARFPRRASPRALSISTMTPAIQVR